MCGDRWLLLPEQKGDLDSCLLPLRFLPPLVPLCCGLGYQPLWEAGSIFSQYLGILTSLIFNQPLPRAGETGWQKGTMVLVSPQKAVNMLLRGLNSLSPPLGWLFSWASGPGQERAAAFSALGGCAVHM
jgi:hypothetical protein